MELCLLNRKRVELERVVSDGELLALKARLQNLPQVLPFMFCEPGSRLWKIMQPCLKGTVNVDFPTGESFSILAKRPRPETGATEPTLDISILLQKPSGGSSFFKVCNDSREDNCLSRLGKAFGGLDNLSFSVNIKLFSEVDDVLVKCEKSELHVRQLGMDGSVIGATLGFAVRYADMTDVILQTLTAMSKCTPEITVRVKIADAAFKSLVTGNIEDPLSACKAIRADAASTDAVIICDDGKAKVKCHKAFLSAHSSVFKAMFESGMEEGRSGELKLLNMSEAGVQALLDYLYCWDVKGICKNCSIALELLIAADKYDITRLQESIQRLLIWKEANWYTVSVAVQLLDFSKKRVALMQEVLGDGEGVDTGLNKVYKAIEAKSMAVLKSKSTAELHECPDFQQLFEDPKVAMEFCTYVMLFGQ